MLFATAASIEPPIKMINVGCAIAGGDDDGITSIKRFRSNSLKCKLTIYAAIISLNLDCFRAIKCYTSSWLSRESLNHHC